MARVTYGGGTTNFAGSIAGTTFQKTRAGSIARTRTTRASRTTPKMALIQLQTFNSLQRWRSLVVGQQDYWNAYAALHDRIDLFGVTHKLSGCNWFVSINSNLALVGSAQVENPPTYVLPDAPATFDLVTNGTTIAADYSFHTAPADTFIVVQSTPPMQGTTQSFRSLLRLTATAEAIEIDDWNFTTEWEVAHGLTLPPSDPANFNVGAILYTIHTSSGVASPGLLSQAKWTPT